MSTTASETLTPTQGGTDHRHLGWALVLISIAQLMVVLDGTITNIALPYIAGDLGIGEENVAWIVTGYALAFGGFLLLGSRLGDLYGRRLLFIIGVTLFAGASLVGGFAQNEAMLLSSRAIQGIGAAIASPTALALITTTFPAGQARNRAFAVYAAMSGAGAAVGLILGGWLTGLEPTILGHDVAGWRLTFFLVVPFGIVASALAPYALMESERHPGELDILGGIIGTASLVALVFGFTRAGQEAYGWDSAQTLVSLGLGAALMALFVWVESRITHPLLPFHILKDRTRATSFIVMMLVPAAMFSMFFFLSLYIQNVLGYSSMKTGLAFLPFSFGMILGAGSATKFATKLDPRWLASFGTLLASAAVFGMSRIPFDATLPGIGSNANYWTDIFPFIVLMSTGMGFVFVPLTLTAVHGIADHESGIGSGVLNTAQQVGGAVGLAVLSTVWLHGIHGTAADLADQAAKLGPAAGLPADPKAVEQLFGAVAFTHGATQAFLVGAGMVLLATAIIVAFMRVKKEELANDGAPPVAH
jgi:EmrB/QacA subfamily drug resistance transporter